MKQRKHRYQFPDGFLWGSSTSGPQSEGTVPGDGKGPSNWVSCHNSDRGK